MTELNLTGLKLVFGGFMLLIFSKLLNWLPDFIFYSIVFYGLFELSILYPKWFEAPKQGSVMLLALEMCQYLSYKFLPNALMLILVFFLKWTAIAYMLTGITNAMYAISEVFNNRKYNNETKIYRCIFTVLCILCVGCNVIIFINPLQFIGYIGLMAYITFCFVIVFFALHIHIGYSLFNKQPLNL